MLTYILLVDDDEDEHLFFRWSLEKIELKICIFDALNAADVLEIIKKVVPDFIFLDINLKGENGFECLELIRNMPLLKNVPVFMYSTEITDYTIRKAIAAGASGCLKKSRSYAALRKNLLDLLTPVPSVNIQN